MVFRPINTINLFFVTLLVCTMSYVRSVDAATIDAAQHAALMQLYDANPLCIGRCVRFAVDEECPSNNFITCSPEGDVLQL